MAKCDILSESYAAAKGSLTTHGSLKHSNLAKHMLIFEKLSLLNKAGFPAVMGWISVVHKMSPLIG